MTTTLDLLFPGSLGLAIKASPRAKLDLFYGQASSYQGNQIHRFGCPAVGSRQLGIFLILSTNSQPGNSLLFPSSLGNSSTVNDVRVHVSPDDFNLNKLCYLFSSRKKTEHTCAPGMKNTTT